MGTLELDAMLDNPNELLRPGMFVMVRAAVDEVKDAMLVPQKSIVAMQGKQFVAVLGADDKVQLVPVTTGPMQGDMIVVSGALTQDARIVVTGTQQAMMAAAGRALLKTETAAANR